MPRPRFQFRLRTLFAVMTVAAVTCGYVGWQARIVNERRQLLGPYIDPDQHLPAGVDIFDLSLAVPGDQAEHAVPWLRRWMGDVPIYRIWLDKSTDPKAAERYRQVFPEAIIEFDPPPADR